MQFVITTLRSHSLCFKYEERIYCVSRRWSADTGRESGKHDACKSEMEDQRKRLGVGARLLSEELQISERSMYCFGSHGDGVREKVRKRHDHQKIVKRYKINSPFFRASTESGRLEQPKVRLYQNVRSFTLERSET